MSHETSSLILVGNLPKRCSKFTLINAFQKFGPLGDVSVSRDGNRPSGHVQFRFPSDAPKAVKDMNGTLLSGSKITVQFACPQTPKEKAYPTRIFRRNKTPLSFEPTSPVPDLKRLTYSLNKSKKRKNASIFAPLLEEDSSELSEVLISAELVDSIREDEKVTESNEIENFSSSVSGETENSLSKVQEASKEFVDSEREEVNAELSKEHRNALYSVACLSGKDSLGRDCFEEDKRATEELVDSIRKNAGFDVVNGLVQSDWERGFRIRGEYLRKYGFSLPCKELTDAIMEYQPLVEIGCGTGFLSSVLLDKNCDVKPTDKYKEWFGDHHYCDVEFLNAIDAVKKYKGRNVLCSWPRNYLRSVLPFIESGTKLLLIGESGDGCTENLDASDSCFETVVKNFRVPTFPGLRDCLTVYEKK